MHEQLQIRRREPGNRHRQLISAASLVLAVTAITVLAVILPLRPAGALDPRPHCGLCRRFTDVSPARFQAYVPVGKHSIFIDACSLFCLFEQLEDYDEEPSSVFTTDYATVGDNDGLRQRAERMHYVFDSPEGDAEKSNAPFTYAFMTKAAAQEFADEFGGEVLDWDEAVAATVELTDAWEPKAKHPGPGTADPYRKQRR